MYSYLRFLFFTCLIFISPIKQAYADRIKDLTSLAGIRSNQLVGYGVVVGLAGSGDGNTGITLQSMHQPKVDSHKRVLHLTEDLVRFCRGT